MLRSIGSVLFVVLGLAGIIFLAHAIESQLPESQNLALAEAWLRSHAGGSCVVDAEISVYGPNCAADVVIFKAHVDSVPKTFMVWVCSDSNRAEQANGGDLPPKYVVP